MNKKPNPAANNQALPPELNIQLSDAQLDVLLNLPNIEALTAAMQVLTANPNLTSKTIQSILDDWDQAPMTHHKVWAAMMQHSPSLLQELINIILENTKLNINLKQMFYQAVETTLTTHADASELRPDSIFTAQDQFGRTVCGVAEMENYTKKDRLLNRDEAYRAQWAISAIQRGYDDELILLNLWLHSHNCFQSNSPLQIVARHNISTNENLASGLSPTIYLYINGDPTGLTPELQDVMGCLQGKSATTSIGRKLWEAYKHVRRNRRIIMLSVFEEIRIRDYGAQQREEERESQKKELQSILAYLRQQGRENEYFEASINDKVRNKILAEINNHN